MALYVMRASKAALRKFKESMDMINVTQLIYIACLGSVWNALEIWTLIMEHCIIQKPVPLDAVQALHLSHLLGHTKIYTSFPYKLVLMPYYAQL